MANNELQRPGAGLPELERLLLSAGLNIGSAFISKRRALNRFKRESQKIWELIDQTDIPIASEPRLISRMMGMEDSSRDWSLLMVVHHLCLVNTDVLKIINALCDGVTPHGTLDIADYKPDPDVDLDVLDRFRMLNDDLEAAVESKKSLRSVAQMRHPWFGALSAHGWLCLAAVHQGLHCRQAKRVLAKIGRV